MVSIKADNGRNNSNRVNIFYFSDYHGNISAYRHLQSASDEFDRRHNDKENLKLAAGDLTAGKDHRKNMLLYRMLKKMKIDASAVGNHEWDNGIDFYKKFHELNNKAPYLLFNNYLSCNTNTRENEKYKKEGLFQSKIITKNNEKYGIIGATTFDDYNFKHCKMDNLENTKKNITDEVKKLKKLDTSLNKFILVSHLGDDVDKNIAQTVQDIDIIIGGHTHKLIEGVKDGKNLFISPKMEPVLVVQAGNEKYFGELSVVFDKNGRLDLSKGNEPINKIGNNKNYPESPKIKELEEKLLPPAEYLGHLLTDINPNNHLVEENPLGNLNADALRKKTGADIALLNAGGFRSFINAGPVTTTNLEYCLPFSNDVVKIKCKGKDIADIIKLGVKSTKNQHANPGLYQVSGLKYTVTADKNVKNLYTVDENDNKNREIIDSKGNIVSRNANHLFDVAMTDYMIEQLAKRGILTDFVEIDDDEIEVNEKRVKDDYGIQREVLKDYLKSDFADKNKPINIDTGRITFENRKKIGDLGFLALSVYKF